MVQLKFTVEFKGVAFDRIGAFLRYVGIEHELVRSRVSADFVDMHFLPSQPTKSPFADYMQDVVGPSEMRDSAYFWGGIFPESLRKTNLTPRDFANTLSIAYSHMPDLYEPAIEKAPAILEAFHEAYQSLSEGIKDKYRLLH
ncbi:MAG: hypothetical protein ACLFPL_03570 [Candidatus Nanoarchaeia archaeon]